MYSKSKKVHETALKLFESLENEEILKYEIMHKEIIDKFGRYPSRNAILNRPPTKEGLEFLKDYRGF